MISSVIALLSLAYGLHLRTKLETSNREDWQDLNQMMREVYSQNDALKADLHRAGKHVALLESVNRNLKNTVDDMSHAKNELMDKLSTLERSMDGLLAEIEYMKNPPPPQAEPTEDELDEWYTQQADSDKPKLPGVSPLFAAIRDAFTPTPPPGYDAKKDS